MEYLATGFPVFPALARNVNRNDLKIEGTVEARRDVLYLGNCIDQSP
jgi:hypothetical protein